MKVAVFSPTLQGYGGLERYLLDFIQASTKLMPITVVTGQAPRFAEIRKAYDLELDYGRISFLVDPDCDPQIGNAWQRLQAQRRYASLTRAFDLVIASSWLTPWLQKARRALYLCHFPIVRPLARVTDEVAPSRFTREGRMQRELRGRLASWRSMVSSSEFGRHWLQAYWQRGSGLLYPGVGVDSPRSQTVKQNRILACGFFAAPAAGELYSYKRQEVLIEAFRRLSATEAYQDYELHLCGHVTQDEKGQAVLANLRNLAQGLNVVLHPNCDTGELVSLYQSARYFWHGTGFGLDPQKDPGKLEHFGIVTVEAMTWGCVPLVFGEGGQREIVEVGISGYWWHSIEELVGKMLHLSEDHQTTNRFSENARQRALKFAPRQFERQAQEILLRELELIQTKPATTYGY